jgi:hypothetical protein
MNAYVEVRGEYTMGPRKELTDSDLREIGEFTRENVSRWVDRHVNPLTYEGDVCVDFHAVCGDPDIPWADENAKVTWESNVKYKEMYARMSKEEVDLDWERRVRETKIRQGIIDK